MIAAQVIDYIPLTEVDSLISAHGKLHRDDLDSYSPAAHVEAQHEDGDDKADDDSNARTFVIKTDPRGHNGGRAYIFRTAHTADCRDWVHTLATAIRAAYRNQETADLLQQLEGNSLEWARFQARAFYMSRKTQVIICLVIIVSFVCDVLEAELLPDFDSPDKHEVQQVIDRVQKHVSQVTG